MTHIELYWDPSREVFMDSDGIEVLDVCKWLPYWALELARIYRSMGQCFFAFTIDANTYVEVYWPDEEDENWYL